MNLLTELKAFARHPILYPLKKAGGTSVPFSVYGGNAGGYGTGYDGAGYGDIRSLAGYGTQPGAAFDYVAAAGNPAENAVVAMCCDAISQALPDAPPMLEQRKGTNWERVDDKSGLLDLLNRPNGGTDNSTEGYSSAHLWAATMQSELTTGNAFWRLVLDGRGVPSEIYWEPAMFPRWDAEHFISDYLLRVDGKPFILPTNQVVHFRYALHPSNPRLGWTPLFTALRHVAGDNAVATYHAALLRNNAMASMVFSAATAEAFTSGSISRDQFFEIVKKWERKFTGEGAGGIGAINIPMKVDKVGYSPDEMALETMPDYFAQRICGALKVPGMVIGLDTQGKTYANYGEAIRDFWERTVKGIRGRHSLELGSQLLPLFGLDPADYRIGWDFSNVPALQEDKAEVHDIYRGDFAAGAIDRYTFKTKAGYEAEDTDKEVYAKPPAAPQDGAPEPDAVPPQPGGRGAVPGAIAAKFDDSEPRDESGRWTSGLSSIAKTIGVKKPRRGENTAYFEDASGDAVKVAGEHSEWVNSHHEELIRLVPELDGKNGFDLVDKVVAKANLVRSRHYNEDHKFSQYIIPATESAMRRAEIQHRQVWGDEPVEAHVVQVSKDGEYERSFTLRPGTGNGTTTFGSNDDWVTSMRMHRRMYKSYQIFPKRGSEALQEMLTDRLGGGEEPPRFGDTQTMNTDSQPLEPQPAATKTEPDADAETYDINTVEELGLSLAEVEADHPLLAPFLRAKTVNKPRQDAELKRYDPDQPRDDIGRWTIIRGQRASITGREVGREDVAAAADKHGVSEEGKQALLKAHDTGKIKTDDHLLRAIAHGHEAGGTAAAFTQGAERHGVGGSHEGRPTKVEQQHRDALATTDNSAIDNIASRLDSIREKLATSKAAAQQIEDADKRKEAVRAARDEFNAETEKALAPLRISPDELPPISGTEKQIPWATEVRDSILKQWNSLDMIRGWTVDFPKTHVQKIKNVMEGFRTLDDAGFWISNRYGNAIENLSHLND